MVKDIMRANELFYSCIIPFFNSVLEFYLVIVTIKIITAQNMTVKQETLIYQQKIFIITYQFQNVNEKTSFFELSTIYPQFPQVPF